MIFEYINLKQDIKQRITFQDFFKNVETSYRDEKKFRDAIQSMYLRGIINQKSSGFRKFVETDYNYTEILLIEVNLESMDNTRFIEEKIQSAFSNPVIMILKCQEMYRISLAKKRVNKNLEHETVIEETIYTEYFTIDNSQIINYCSLLNIQDMQVVNLRDLYNQYFMWVQYHYLLKYLDIVPQLKKDEKILNLIEEIKENEKKISYYLVKKKKERQVSDRMHAHTQLVHYKNKNKKDITKLREATR